MVYLNKKELCFSTLLISTAFSLININEKKMKKILVAFLGLFVCSESNSTLQPIAQVGNIQNSSAVKTVNLDECKEISSKIDKNDLNFYYYIENFATDCLEFIKVKQNKKFQIIGSYNGETVQHFSVLFPVGFQLLPYGTQKFEVIKELKIDENTTPLDLVLGLSDSLQVDVF